MTEVPKSDLYRLEVSTLVTDDDVTFFVSCDVFGALVEPDRFDNPSAEEIRTAIQVMTGRMARIAINSFTAIMETNRRGFRFLYSAPHGDTPVDELGTYNLGFHVSVPRDLAAEWQRRIGEFMADVRALDQMIVAATQPPSDAGATLTNVLEFPRSAPRPG